MKIANIKMQNKKNSTSAIRLIKGIIKEKKPCYMPKETPFEVLDDLAVLHYCGALVTAVASPQAALDVMGLIKPDVLVVDLTEGDRDGHWLIRQVRALKPEDGGVIPVIALGAGSSANLARAGAAGFVACLVKPIDPWQLCRVIAGVTASS